MFPWWEPRLAQGQQEQELITERPVPTKTWAWHHDRFLQDDEDPNMKLGTMYATSRIMTQLNNNTHKREVFKTENENWAQ